MLAEELGEQIRRRRDVLQITQPDLAELADINVNTLYRIETGKANPTLKVLQKLLEVLGMELKLEVKRPGI